LDLKKSGNANAEHITIILDGDTKKWRIILFR